MNKIYFVITAFAMLFILGCEHKSGEHEHEHEKHDEATHDEESHEGHDHEGHGDEDDSHNHGSKTVTHLQDGYEVYLETEQWVLNETANLTIHLTKLSDYSPITVQEIGVIIKGSKKQSISAHSHLAGIYHLTYKADEVESKQMRIAFKDGEESVYLFINDLIVYSGHDDMPESASEDPGLVEYTKEQAWNEQFGLEPIQLVSTPRLIKASGELMPAPGDEFILTAMHAGTVSLNKTLIEGKQIKAGDVISTISSSLIHENMTNKYLRAKNEYGKAKIDFNRARNLIDEKLISEKEYLEAKLNYESSKNTFENISKYYNDGNQQLKSLTDGYIRTVFVKEGQYIEEGQPIATIIRNKRVLLKAYVPQQYNHLSSGIFDANFSPVYTSKIYSIKEFNGSRISYSSALPDNSQFVPLYFEIDAHQDIMPGSYAEVYLKAASFENNLTVPKSALMEDQGNYYVFVQKDGEHYLKTYVTLGDSDGFRAVVNFGLNINDVVVTKGAYQVYLASLGSSAPSQTHSH